MHIVTGTLLADCFNLLLADCFNLFHPKPITTLLYQSCQDISLEISYLVYLITHDKVDSPSRYAAAVHLMQKKRLEKSSLIL